MRHVLVLQWPGSSEGDFEDLLRMEDELARSLGEAEIVDGHDFGSGQMNIFIETDEPAGAFAAVETVLSQKPRWADVRAAHREAAGETYTVLWPLGDTDFSVK